MESLATALWLLLLLGAVVFPPLLLFMGWRDMKAKRFERADTRATLAAMASLVQALLVGGVASLAILIQEQTPFVMAVLAVPVAFWVLSRKLHGSIHRHRDAVRRDARLARSHESGPS